MGEVMNFPDTVEEFMEKYKIVDSEQVYTNGAELVPIFRMKQWFEHMQPTIDQLESMPSAQSKWLTKDDWETIRIHLNAFKENLCNQRRWKEAEEYQRIIDKIMTFTSVQPERTLIGYGTYKPDVLSEYLRLRNEKLPSAQLDTSGIENALRGKSAEEQYDFIWWLITTDMRSAVIEWLKGERNG